ncbi:MAG: hypothetical protein AB1813_17290 [Verrucomicrobiota bacterium]
MRWQTEWQQRFGHGGAWGLSCVYGNGQSGVALSLCRRSPKVVGGGAMAGAAERALWSALAECSGDSALAVAARGGCPACMEMAKAVSRYRFATAVQKWWAAER